MATTPINTQQVPEHRKLRFATIAECLEEVDRVVAAEHAGTLTRLGNWSAGQNLAHIAAWIEYGYEGFPVKPPPFFVRWYLRWQLRKYLAGAMPLGVKIPGVPNGTTGMDAQPTPIAAERLKKAFLRLQSGEPAKYDSPAFGQMSHADRIQLNLRHAELHLGFLSY